MEKGFDGQKDVGKHPERMLTRREVGRPFHSLPVVQKILLGNIDPNSRRGVAE